jgi:hypothetical protein
MGPLELRVFEALGVCNRAEIYASELYLGLQCTRHPQEARQRPFPEIPVPRPPSQLANSSPANRTVSDSLRRRFSLVLLKRSGKHRSLTCSRWENLTGVAVIQSQNLS